MLIYYLYFVGGACLLLFALMLLALIKCVTGLSYNSVYSVALFFNSLRTFFSRVVAVKFRGVAL